MSKGGARASTSQGSATPQIAMEYVSLYEIGKGGPQELKRAAELYELAAKQDNVYALVNFGERRDVREGKSYISWQRTKATWMCRSTWVRCTKTAKSSRKTGSALRSCTSFLSTRAIPMRECTRRARVWHET